MRLTKERTCTMVQYHFRLLYPVQESSPILHLCQSLNSPRAQQNILTIYSGLFSFATVTLVASLMDVHARGVTISNAILGMALCVGGLTQFIAGMWEFARGNTFNATGKFN